MFVLFVPVRSYSYKGRRYGALTESKQEADSSESGKVFGRGETHADTAPNDAIQAFVLACLET